MPTLHLIAGVNGAGKTSFYRYQLAEMIPGAEFVNADELAREKWPGSQDRHVAEAARLAAERRMALLERRESFVTETVFSHESKLELVTEAKLRGFRVVIYHVHVNSAVLARERVRTRISQGGHPVPEDRIEGRFERSLRLIPRAAELADVTFVFDNSGTERTHTHVMTLDSGRVTTLHEPVPAWVERAYGGPLSVFRGGSDGR